MKADAVLAVAVGISLLEFGIQTDYMVGNLSELVVGERFDIRYPDAFLGALSKAVETDYVLPDTTCGKISKRAHYQCDGTHYPQKSVVSFKKRVKRHHVGHGRAHNHAIISSGSRIEICLARAFAVSVHGISAPLGDGLHDFFAPGVVLPRHAVGIGVKYYISRLVEHADAQLVKRVEIRIVDFVQVFSFVEFGDDEIVDELKLRVYLCGLELLLPVILENDEAPYKEQGVAEQPDEQPPGVAQPFSR